MRVVVLHNPTAGDEEPSDETLRAVLERAGHEVSLNSTKEAGWEDALGAPVELVVAAGGDGTVRKVFRQLAGRDVPVTILPLGTANNIARSLGFEDDDPERLVDGWPAGLTKAYDVAAVTSVRGEAPFVESAGVGLFADVIVRADKDRGEHSDKVEKGLRMLLASIADGAVVSCDLELDDSRVTEDLVGLEVMNVSYAGPQIPLAPEADSADGALDVVIIRPGDVAPLRAHAEARLAGAAPEPLWFDVRRAVEIHLHLPSGSILHTDDELLERGEGDEPLMVRPAAQVQVLIPGSPA